MTFAVDNRFQVGGSGHTQPDTAIVAYGARWIDQGDLMLPDIVPDRQGFARSDEQQMYDLIGHLHEHRVREQANLIDHDETRGAINLDGFVCYVRRAGGYFYVDAWIDRP